jgi:hypothetical protein
VVANVEDRNRVGAEIPRVRIELPPSASADQLVSMLRAGQPSIISRSHEPGVAHVGLDLLVDGQLEILTDRLLASVRSCAASGSD